MPRAGGMAQVVECLPSKHKALCSNPMLTKKKKICQNVKKVEKPGLKALSKKNITPKTKFSELINYEIKANKN
jgi:hypothetical protein